MPMRFFGERWDAPMLDDGIPVATPVEMPCIYACGEPIVEGDQGVLVPCVDLDEQGKPYAKMTASHRECWTRMTVGSVDHLEGRCMCVRTGKLLGDEQPPQGSVRDEGRATIAWLEDRRRGGHAR
jgi:hypothetical protein